MLPVFQEICKTLFTCALAFAFGALFKYWNSPAPYLLGSLFGVWLKGSMVKPLNQVLGIPRWIHVPIILGLGVLIGGMFSPQVTDDILAWTPTLFFLILVTILATASGYYFLTRIRGYEHRLAILCSLPGGQAEIILLSRDWVEKDYVVALCHLVRVTTVLCITPLILWWLEGSEAVLASNRMQSSLPGLAELPLIILAQFVGTALAGYIIGRAIKLPIPHLLGPLLLSMGLHILGWISIPRIQEFILAVQIVIGGAIGARLAKVELIELAQYALDSLINATILILLYVLAAYGVAQFIPVEFVNLLLAFLPGGIYEVTLLSLLFGFDVAFVAFHHALRVLLVFFALPLFIGSLKRN
jgi:membrane AbrB-like protein